MNEVANIEPANPIEQVATSLLRMENKLRELLPEKITPAKFRGVVMTAIQNKPEILEADRRTLFLACLKAAEQGLMPDGREGAIVVRNVKLSDNPKRYGKVANWQPMYAGLIKVMHNSGTVASINAQIVYEGEPFKVLLGDEDKIYHERLIDKIDDEKIFAVYAIVTIRNTETGEAGEKIRRIMSKSQINKVRNAGSAADGPFWKKWPGEMAIKSVIRNISKMIPWSPEDMKDQRARAAIESVDSLYNFDSDRAQRAAKERADLEAAAEAAGLPKDDLPNTFIPPDRDDAPPPPKTDSKIAFINGEGQRLQVPDIQTWQSNWLGLVASFIRAKDLDGLRDHRDRNKAVFQEVRSLGPWAVDAVESALRKALGEAEPTIIEGTATEQHPEDETREQEIARENAEREEAERLAAARAKAAEEHGKRPLSDSLPGGASGTEKAKGDAKAWKEVPYLDENGFPLAAKTPKAWGAGITAALAVIGDDLSGLVTYRTSMQPLFQSMKDSGVEKITGLAGLGEMLIQQAIGRAQAAARAAAGGGEDESESAEDRA